MYGPACWVAHHNTSLWRESLADDKSLPPLSGQGYRDGLSSHLWEHYLYSGDQEFLKNTAYPLTKGAAEFFADWLIDDGKGPAGYILSVSLRKTGLLLPTEKQQH